MSVIDVFKDIDIDLSSRMLGTKYGNRQAQQMSSDPSFRVKPAGHLEGTFCRRSQGKSQLFHSKTSVILNDDNISGDFHNLCYSLPHIQCYFVYFISSEAETVKKRP